MADHIEMFSLSLTLFYSQIFPEVVECRRMVALHGMHDAAKAFFIFSIMWCLWWHSLSLCYIFPATFTPSSHRLLAATKARGGDAVMTASTPGRGAIDTRMRWHQHQEEAAEIRRHQDTDNSRQQLKIEDGISRHVNCYFMFVCLTFLFSSSFSSLFFAHWDIVGKPGRTSRQRFFYYPHLIFCFVFLT